MSRKILFLFCCFFCLAGQAQEENILEKGVVDSLYREDQFYLGFTYNIITGSSDISQTGFSGGFHAGFIRDFPINERRNIALGVGLGWAVNTYGQNLFIGEEPDSEETVFEIMNRDLVDYDRNRFSTQALEVPLQFRWRTSTPEGYKFWRVYTGLRIGYVYYFNSYFSDAGITVRQTDVPEFNRLRLGATFTFGYNTFNFHFYYGLNSFFNGDARIGNEKIELGTLQVGLMFYLL